jgi:hypothetical protein
VIDASGADGGRVVLAAARGASGAGNVQVNGAILANASGDAFGTGGYVLLASATQDGVEPGVDFAAIGMGADALIDVSGVGGGVGGEVYLRAPDSGAYANGVAVDLAGQVLGAAKVTLEAFKVFDDIASITSSLITGALQAQHGVADLDALALQGGLDLDGATMKLVAGYEVRNAGDITVSGEVNFSGLGILTVRADGDLLVNKSLSDGFSTATTTGTLQGGDSWSYRLVAGADAGGANPLALKAADELDPDKGDVALAAGAIVRTGTGFIDIAAGGDVTTASETAVIYTAGAPFTPAGLVYTQPTSTQNPSFPAGGGDVSILAQGDIVFAASSQLVVEWLYRQGWLNDSGALANATGASNSRPNPAWWINFPLFKQGVGTLGGGDISVVAGGDIVGLSAATPSNGRLGGASGTLPDPANLAVQGGGDLTVLAGGDILGGVYYATGGTATIRAGGAVGASQFEATTPNPIFALGEDAVLDITAGAGIVIQDVVDPLLLPQATGNYSSTSATNIFRQSYFTRYGDSTVHALSVAGDVDFLVQSVSGNGQGVLPPTLVFVAPQGDIAVSGQVELLPAQAADLMLLAGGSLALSADLTMYDYAEGIVPTILNPRHTLGSGLFVEPVGTSSRDSTVARAADTTPAYFVALAGDIFGRDKSQNNAGGIVLAEPFYVQAGGDVLNLSITGQHFDALDVSRIYAGGDIRFETNVSNGSVAIDERAIRIGGPGRLEVLAGEDIDLAGTLGIVSVGTADNPFLPDGGAALLVAAGLGTGADGQVKQPDYAGFSASYLGADSEALARYWDRQEDLIRRELEHNGGAASETEVQTQLAQAHTAFAALDQETQTVRVFFNELREGGLIGGATLDYSLGRDAIATLFPDIDASGAHGDINLFFSQIKTEQGGDLVLFAPTGNVNAGLANPGGLSKPAAQLGIVTVGGGNIWSLVDQDFLVNQSRVFTLKGGDILLWSEHGDIDAGRGSKTASATPPPRRTVRNGAIVLDITGSIAGSGIGVLLSDATVVPGDVDLIAPEGSVNAGDAGIRAAGNINIAAVTVVGADNISVGGISTGAALAAPVAAPVSTGNVAAEATRATDAIAQAVADATRAQEELKKSFRPSFITVEVIGLGEG